MQHLYTDSEFNVSFPCWFNDSIVREMKIAKLSRSNYRINDEDEGSEELKEVKRYTFDKNGHVIRYEIEQYYDHRSIGLLVFDYTKPRDEYGFASVKIDRKFTTTDSEEEAYYQIYKKEQYSKKFLVYVNDQIGNYMFCLLNQKNWGIVSVDTIAKPTPEDIVIYGTPEHPEKKFQIKNKVNEFNITEIKYNPQYGFAETINFDNYPFNNKRSLNYHKDGTFDTFIDSTFSGDQFLNRSVSRMEFDENKLPISVLRDYYMEGEIGGYSEIERFTYEYY